MSYEKTCVTRDYIPLRAMSCQSEWLLFSTRFTNFQKTVKTPVQMAPLALKVPLVFEWVLLCFLFFFPLPQTEFVFPRLALHLLSQGKLLDTHSRNSPFIGEREHPWSGVTVDPFPNCVLWLFYLHQHHSSGENKSLLLDGWSLPELEYFPQVWTWLI